MDGGYEFGGGGGGGTVGGAGIVGGELVDSEDVDERVDDALLVFDLLVAAVEMRVLLS